MEATTKSNSDLVSSWIEHESQERTREFRKYWEHHPTPQNEIEDLIKSDPDRAAEIIIHIVKEIEDNEYLETKLICGLIYDFEHFTGDKYTEVLLKRLANQQIYKYLTPNKI